MKIAVRVLIYLLLVVLAVWTGRGFIDSFRSGTGARDLTEDALLSTETPRSAASENPAPDTNAAPTGAAGTNRLSEATNVVASATTNGGPVAAEAGATNAAALAENTTNAPAETAGAAPTPSRAEKKKKDGGSLMVAYLGGFVLSVAALGLLGARDFSAFFANKSLEFLFNDDGKGVKNPELEAAEAVWASGDRLEAIRLMRDYYERNPREVFVSLRIAEIYEQDLGNYLAAALEIEEVLKKKLPPDRWGWSALRLCNLYSKLDKSDKAIELLRRVAVEYAETPAAAKARKRLEQVDPDFLASLAPLPSAPEAVSDDSKEAPAPEQAKSNLPPGFRPKK